MASQEPPQSFVAAHKPTLSALLHMRSDSAIFSSMSSVDNMGVNASDMTDADADEQEARDMPAPKLHRVGSTRRTSAPGGERRPMERRYSVGEDPASRSSRYVVHDQQATTVDMSADQQSAPQQNGNGGAKGLMELIHSKGVLKRLSRSSLLPSPTSSYFAAAKAVTTKEDTAGQQYEEMMERFQIRRIQYTASSGSVGRDDPHSHAAVRSSKVIPVDGDGAPPPRCHSNTTPCSHSSLLKVLPPTTARDPPRQPPPASERDLQQPAPQVPTLVIKPRSSIHKGSEGIAKAVASAHGSKRRLSLYWTIVSWKRRLRRSFQPFVKQISSPMSPYSTAARVRGLVLLLAFIAHAILFPTDVAFSHSEWRGLRYVDFVTEFVFMFDFVLSFNTSFLDKRGALVSSRREIARNYLRGWCFPELLAAIPIELILQLRGEDDGEWMHVFFDGVIRIQRLVHIVRILRLIWMVNVSRSGKSIWAWLLYSRYSHLLRIVWIVQLIVLLAHYMACTWKLLEDSSVQEMQTKMTVAEQYAANFYDALQLLQGQGLATTTIGQSVFASFSVLLGSLVLAIVFGEVAMLVSNFNANSTNYQRKMEAVFAVMGKLQLPALLRERIHQYFEHLWREYESLDGEIVKFSKDLTHNLALEVVLFKYMDLVINIPFWRDCTPDFQKQIVLSLQVRVYLPDDFILRRGEVGDEFYMINRGSCELSTGADSFEQATVPLNPRVQGDTTRQSADASRYADSVYYGHAKNEPSQDDGDIEFDKRSRFRTERASDHDGRPRKKKKTSKYTRLLIRGQAFGEIALLMNYQRTANVRAVTYVEMCVLSRADFQTILTRYPDDRKSVLSNILTTCMESNEARQVNCPLKEIVKLVFADGDTLTANHITARYAASIISTVVDPDYEDDSMMFGIGINLKSGLVKLKEQDEAQHWAGNDGLPSQSSSRLTEFTSDRSDSMESGSGGSSALGSDQNRLSELETRVQKIESTQMHTLLLLQEIRVAMGELRQAPASAQFPPATSAEWPQPPMHIRIKEKDVQAATPVTRLEGGSVGSTSALECKVATAGIPNFTFMCKRSLTDPSLIELSQALARRVAVEAGNDAATDVGIATEAPVTTRKRLHTAEQPSPNTDEKLKSARSASHRRSATLRDLTEKQKSEVSTVKVAPPSLQTRTRGASFKLRKKSQQDMRSAKAKASRSGSSLTKRLIMQHIGSLVPFAFAPQQSPTCYADQLFYARELPVSVLDESSTTTEVAHE